MSEGFVKYNKWQLVSGSLVVLCDLEASGWNWTKWRRKQRKMMHVGSFVLICNMTLQRNVLGHGG